MLRTVSDVVLGAIGAAVLYTLTVLLLVIE